MIATLLSSLILSQAIQPQGGRPMPTVEDLKGKTLSPMSFAKGQKVAVFIFVLADCPNANTFVPEVKRIANDYGKKGVKFYFVYEDPDIKAAAAAKHTKEFGITFQSVIDTRHTLAKRLSASRSPQAAVVLPNQQVPYMGRIDDRYVALGKKRREPTRRDLRIALDEVLAGKAVTLPKTEVIGCVLSL